MSYKIEYGKQMTQKRRMRLRPWLMTFFMFLTFLLSVCRFWPEGCRQAAAFWNRHELLQAVEVFADELQCEISLKGSLQDLIERIRRYADPN